MKKTGVVSLVVLLVLVSCSDPTRTKPQGWVSSGGDDLGHSMNPWFVKNTSEVKYCIAIEPNAISTPASEIPALVRDVFLYWNREFSRQVPLVPEMGDYSAGKTLGIGQQKIQEIACNGSEDVKFHFGYETLDADKRDFLSKNPKSIAATVRTSYDEVNLKGKGFVYISSDRGPYRHIGSEKSVEAPWRYKVALKMVVAHEVGHIFGIPHLSFSGGFMSAQFPEMITSKDLEPMLQSEEGRSDSMPFFVPSSEIDGCFLTEEGKEFFGLEDKEYCLHITLDAKENQFVVQAGKTLQAPEKTLGALKNFTWKPNFEIPVLFYLPTAQTVFELGNNFPTAYLPGPIFVSLEGGGTFTASDGTVKPILLGLNGSRPFSLWGVLKDKLAPLFSSFYLAPPEVRELPLSGS